MKITIGQVEYVAKLARLKLTQEEKELFTQQLNKVLEYMEKLNELDTSGIEPIFYVVPHKNAFREDKVTNYNQREELLKNAPKTKEGFFKVPRVI